MIHSENRLAPRMVLIITNHEYRRKLEQTFQNFRIPIYYQCQGHGTAPSEMLDIFGLSGSSRLLTIGLLPKFLVRDLLDALQQRIPLHKRGGGIVLTIPITGLQRPLLQLMNAADNAHDFRIGNPAGRGDQRLVAGIDDRGQRRVK